MYMSCMAHNSRKECDQMIQSHTNQASKPRSPLSARDRPRFFDQVGHQTTNVSIGNKYFFTKYLGFSCGS